MRAAIFDLDGTLIDLFDLHHKTFQRVVEKHFGLDFTREDLIDGYGLKGEEIITKFLDREDASYEGKDLDAIGDERRDLAIRGVGDVEVLPGVVELLHALKRDGIKIAVGTSARKKMALNVLEAAHLLDFFEDVSAIDDVGRGKPAPDIFLHAAKNLGADPKKCVVFEDSRYGIRAAKAAGMKAVAVLYGSHQGRKALEKENPDLIIESLKELDVDRLKSLF
ncbi:MAG: HAD family phosphatase [Candidatus Altiarchaeota archaeon]